MFVKRRTPAGTSHALASGVGAVVFSPAAAARQARATIKKPYSVLTRALKRPATRNVGDSGTGTPYESANGRFTSVASRSSSRQQAHEEGKSVDGVTSPEVLSAMAGVEYDNPLGAVGELGRDDIKIRQILHMKNETYKKKMKWVRR